MCAQNLEVKDVDVKINENISFNPGKAVNVSMTEGSTKEADTRFQLVEDLPSTDVFVE